MKKIFHVILFCLIWFAPQHLIAQGSSPDLSKKFSAPVIDRIKEVTTKVNLPLQKQLLLGVYFRKQDSLARAAVLKGASVIEIRKYFVTKPEDLQTILSPIELNDYVTTRDNADSRFAIALKHRNDLSLSKMQIDSLLFQLNFQKPLRGQKGGNMKKYEADHLNTILKKDQYISLLAIINKDKAQNLTNIAWQQLKEFGLAKKLDSSKVNDQIFKYETSSVVRLDIASNKNTKKDSVKKNPFIDKPAILIKLDAYNGKSPASQFADVMKYRVQLPLADNQMDSLISKIITLEDLKDSNRAHQIDEFTGVKKFEYDNLTTILNELQFHQYLFYKVQNKAVTKAKTDWDKLKQAGLSTTLDSAKVYNENFAYELNFLIANETYNMDKSQKHLFARKETENIKPDNLKKLDVAIKNLNINNTEKKALAW